MRREGHRHSGSQRKKAAEQPPRVRRTASPNPNLSRTVGSARFARPTTTALRKKPLSFRV